MDLAEPPSEPQAERRQLTVLFCDLVMSTVLATHVDPEVFREVIRTYHAACSRVIEEHGGYIAQYLGDGLLVYFGYPQAHEDDPQRAVRAGLGLVEAVRHLQRVDPSAPTAGLSAPLQVRVGIHTGLVVIGEVGGGSRHERLALGDVPNLAARLQSAAAPETVAISAATARLAEGWFVTEPLGELTLGGFAQPVAAYRVLQESGAQSRFEVMGARGLTPLVGRDVELGVLAECWVRARAGAGQVVLLSGEAGIGKSRLVDVLRRRLAREPHFRLDARCSAYAEHSAFNPVIDLLRRILRFQDSDAPGDQLRKVEDALAAVDVASLEGAPLLAALLSLPLESRYPPLALTAEQQKQKTMEALVSVLLAMAARRAVLLTVEDIHWADPSTLELLGLLIDRIPAARVLSVLVFRSDFHVPWPTRGHVRSLSVARLSRQQSETMVMRVAGGKALPAEVVHQVVTKTDGVPLFVEELTKMVLESDWLQEREDRYELTAPLPSLAIPATLSDSLMARLDRLSTAKTVAQLGAVIGRTFSFDLLRVVSPIETPALEQALEQLVDSQVLYQSGRPTQASYTFKHALIQDAAYESLLRRTRQQYHQRIAQALATEFQAMVANEPELLAHHYKEAGLLDEAIPYWLAAGRRAVERSANAEAIAHLSKGLQVLAMVPPTPERVRQELALHLALGAPLLMIKGNTAPEVERVYIRAQELCQQLGDSPQLFSALIGLWRFALNQPRLKIARSLAEQCFSLAQRLQDSVHLQEAHLMLGSTLVYLGEPAAAREHLERSMALYDPQHSRSLTFIYGTDPRVVCVARLAWALWLLGHPDQALTRVYEALALAQDLGHTFSLAFAMHYTAMMHLCRREAAKGRERAEATMAFSREHGFAQWLTGGTFLRGWALSEQGLVEEGIAELRQAQVAWTALGTGLAKTHISVRLAEALEKSGRIDEGLSTIGEALESMSEHAERYFAAELYRLQGELLWRRTSPTKQGTESTSQVAACFQRALDVAREQGAKSLELRAVMSLCRLWQRQGRLADARLKLDEITGWFKEGFDTLDLQEALALRAALA
jgi:class 3 adenylate cyclase/predicted ATPase